MAFDNNQSRQRRPYDRGDSEFDERIIQVNRVTKKTKGGNQMRFSVLTVVGDKKGNVGVGLGKGPDVASSIRKGFAIAKQNMVNVPIVNGTIPHRVDHKYGASRIMIKPASEGTGLIAGGVVRAVADVAGIKDMVSKILGTNNKITNVYCMIEALKVMKKSAIKEAAMAEIA